MSEEISRAEKTGISVSKVKEYYAKKVADDIRKPKDEFEDFYKNELDTLNQMLADYDEYLGNWFNFFDALLGGRREI